MYWARPDKKLIPDIRIDMDQYTYAVEFIANCNVIKDPLLDYSGMDENTYVHCLFSFCNDVHEDQFGHMSNFVFFPMEFGYIAAQVRKHPGRYAKIEDYARLYRKFKELREGERRRYAISLFDSYHPEHILFSIGHAGCMYDRCIYTRRMKAIAAVYIPGSGALSLEEAQLIRSWGKHLKLCAS